jgi:hypothetical protein
VAAGTGGVVAKGGTGLGGFVSAAGGTVAGAEAGGALGDAPCPRIHASGYPTAKYTQSHSTH